MLRRPLPEQLLAVVGFSTESKSSESAASVVCFLPDSLVYLRYRRLEILNMIFSLYEAAGIRISNMRHRFASQVSILLEKR